MMSQWTQEKGVRPCTGRRLGKVREGSVSRAKMGIIQLKSVQYLGALPGEREQALSNNRRLSEPAFKCSCPSRKFPCKHGLGLLLLYASDQAAFNVAEPARVGHSMA